MALTMYNTYTAASYANSIIGIVSGYAESAVNQINAISATVDSLAEVSGVDVPGQISNNIDFNLAHDFLTELTAQLPSEVSTIIIDTDVPAVPDLTDVQDMTDVDIPDFSGTPPSLSIDEAPAFVQYDPPATPAISLPNVPSKDYYTMPAEVTIADVTIPAPLALDIPEFTATLDDEELLTPSNNYEYSEIEYSSSLKTALSSGLLDMIESDTYGFDTNVIADEDRVYQRAREREQILYHQGVEEATRTFASSGFTMPNGALLKAIESRRMDMNNKVSDVNREIMSKKTDMYWEGKKFTYQQAKEVEEMLINLHNATYERALNAAKAQIQVSIDIFNAQVAAYSAKQSRYAVYAQVFEQKIRAELTKIELYKGQLEGARLLDEHNKTIIELYNSKLNAIGTILQNYKIDVDAYNVAATVERTRMEIYRAEVEAFTARIQAKKAEYDAYDSRVRGEIAKADAYKSEAQAYAAIVEGKKAQIESYVAGIEAVVSRNRGLIESYTAQANTLNSLRSAQIASNENEVNSYQAKVAGYSAHMQALGSAFSMSASQEDTEYKNRVLTMQANSETARIELERVVQSAKLQMEAARSKSDAYRSLAASALSAMNCNASLSGSHSESRSESDSESQSHSNTYQTYMNPQQVYGFYENTNAQDGTFYSEVTNIAEGGNTSSYSNYNYDYPMQVRETRSRYYYENTQEIDQDIEQTVTNYN